MTIDEDLTEYARRCNLTPQDVSCIRGLLARTREECAKLAKKVGGAGYRIAEIIRARTP